MDVITTLTRNVNLYISILSYRACNPIRTCVYPILSCVYPMRISVDPIVRTVYQVFTFIVHQVLRLSGFAFIVWIGISWHFHEQINGKTKRSLTFCYYCRVIKYCGFFFCPYEMYMYLLFETKRLSILL